MAVSMLTNSFWRRVVSRPTFCSNVLMLAVILADSLVKFASAVARVPLLPVVAVRKLFRFAAKPLVELVNNCLAASRLVARAALSAVESTARVLSVPLEVMPKSLRL